MDAGGKREGIYVELDVLLDTRIGTLAQLNQQWAINAIQNGYHTRAADEFPDISQEDFRVAYRNRTNEVLTFSTRTNATNILKPLVISLTEQAVSRPYHDGVSIIVNTWPYEMAENVMDEVRTAIEALTLGLGPVELIRMSPEELTPSHCKSSYAAMLMYDYETWLNAHGEAWKTTRIQEITVFAPRIHFAKKPTDEELQEILANTVHPFQAIEVITSPLVELRLMDVGFFSIATPT